jgi:hypothetical protein
MDILALLTDPHAWAALVTLTVLEIVLGIDNLVFLAVLTSRLEGVQARRARMIGLSLAFVFRVVMLAGLTWLMGLTAPVVTLFGQGDPRDPQRGRGPLRDRSEAGRVLQRVRDGDRADCRGRPHLFARLDHHGDRHGG